MKNISSTARALALLFVGASLFASCAKKSDEPKPTPPDKKEDVKPTPKPKEGELPEITKVVLRFGESHLHSKKGVHYIPNNAKLNFSLLSQEQIMTFVKQGDSWHLEKGSPERFIGTEMMSYGTVTSAAPDYALWVRYYDASGKLVNGAYADPKVRSQYQLFIYPSDVKAFDGDEPIDFTLDKTPELMHYEYCDSDPWDKSVQKSRKQDPEDKQAKFLPDTEPIGMKGYLQFKKISKFNLHFVFYHAPKGKLVDDQPAPFYAPNKNFTSEGGKKLFEASVPFFVCGTREFTDELKSAPENKPLDLKDLRSEYLKMANHLMEALGTKEWLKVAADFISLYNGTGAESGGEEY